MVERWSKGLCRWRADGGGLAVFQSPTNIRCYRIRDRDIAQQEALPIQENPLFARVPNASAVSTEPHNRVRVDKKHDSIP